MGATRCGFHLSFLLAFLLSLLVIPLRSEETTTGRELATPSDENETNSVEYKLIADETYEPNKFLISYEVTYGECLFKRFEKCSVIEETHFENRTTAAFCWGQAKFLRIGDAKNISNFDNYTYSSSGFSHFGEAYKASADSFHLTEIDLLHAIQPETISLKANITQAVKSLHFGRIAEDKLSVNFTINSAFFAMNRTEAFSVVTDEETGTKVLICNGQIKVVQRNSDSDQTVQVEDFSLGEEYLYAYDIQTKYLND